MSAVVVAGCQGAITVDAVNRCGRAVEAQGGENADSRGGWVTFRQGEHGGLVSMVENATQVLVEVRTDEDAPITSFVVPIANLPQPTEGDADVEVVLEGDRCPSLTR
jgi:hypothetical protein